MIKKLQNGNFEVTPSWLRDRYEVERVLLYRVHKCEESKGE